MKELKADIAVVSTGTAGLTAAVTAGEGGARVIAVEKLGNTGGTANMGSGPFAVESRLQHLKQVSLTREEAFKIYMDFNHWRVNARLVRAFIDMSASTIDWLEGLGVEFMDVGSHGTGNYYTWHVVAGPPAAPGQPGHAGTMMKILAERATKLGVKFIMKTPVTKILKRANRINGIVAKSSDGQEIRVTAKAVILATGGYGGDFPGLSSLTGDGIHMAQEIGASVRDPIVGQAKARPSIFRSRALSHDVMFTFNQPNLVVNVSGERFMNEEIMVTTPFARNAIATQKDSTAFTIFDEAAKKYYVENGWDFQTAGTQFPVTKPEGFDEEIKKLVERGTDHIFIADSIDELASKTGIERKGLKQAIAEYNKACETGRDELFNKRARYLKPLKNPPFYASKSTVIASPGYEGIKINFKTEVLDKDHRVIPGLYAAGMDAACNIYYDTYPNILPGTAMGFALNSGKLAAENALEYISEHNLDGN